jgi:hypothetical protein
MDAKNLISPRITDLRWGHIRVEGGKSYRDAKLYPGGSREWNWDETGTNHVPGIQSFDVQELLDHGSRIIILSKGMSERLQVRPETLQQLKNQGLQYHILQTENAVALYNEVRKHQPVGGLFHSTC